MKWTFVFLALPLLAACGNESDLPSASGEASVRAINAIPTSGEISFLIEERSIGTARYQDITASTQWDDLEYTFNFDVFYAGETSLRRIASQFLDVVANRDYTFVISGSLANPTITVLEEDVRLFEAEETVFAARFAHTSTTQGALDFYFAEPSIAPAPGSQVATLSAGEFSASTDFPEGEYVITITTAGDHTDVIYTSETVPFAPRNSFFITLFDGDVNDSSPLTVQALPFAGLTVPMRDPSFPPTVEFINVSMDLGTTDIYVDEQLTSLIVSNHGFLDVSNEVAVASGSNTFYYTPTGDTAAVLLEGPLSATSGSRFRFYATGVAGEFGTDVVIPDRKPLETFAKVTMYHASNNFEFLDLYVVDAGESIDDNFAARPAIGRGTQTPNAAFESGSYDIYITEFNDKVALAGPYRIDVVLGDIVDLVVVDTVDPAVLDILFLSGGPTP